MLDDKDYAFVDTVFSLRTAFVVRPRESSGILALTVIHTINLGIVNLLLFCIQSSKYVMNAVLYFETRLGFSIAKRVLLLGALKNLRTLNLQTLDHVVGYLGIYEDLKLQALNVLMSFIIER